MRRPARGPAARRAFSLILVEHPESSQFGSDYRGAVLVRRIAEEDRRPGLTSGLVWKRAPILLESNSVP